MGNTFKKKAETQTYLFPKWKTTYVLNTSHLIQLHSQNRNDLINNESVHLIQARTESCRCLSLPTAIREWNALSPDLQSSPKFSSFKASLNKKICFEISRVIFQAITYCLDVNTLCRQNSYSKCPTIYRVFKTLLIVNGKSSPYLIMLSVLLQLLFFVFPLSLTLFFL